MDESTNKTIKEHEIQAKDWDFRGLSEQLYTWNGRFNDKFFEGSLKTPVISFERTRVNTLGHFVIHRNAFGLKWNININSLWADLPLVDILAIELHELVHLWQQELGKKKPKSQHNNYHNTEFREKAMSLGIPSNEYGVTLYYRNPFLSFLREHGVDIKPRYFMEGSDSVIRPKFGRSKLKKWSCGCTRVRVAVADFKALCLKCGNEFESCEWS